MIETKITSTLDKKEILDMLNKIKYLVCDVDYTVSDFGAGNVTGIMRLKEKLGDEAGEELNIMFDLILRAHRNLELLTSQETREYEQIMKEIEEYTPKYWCREAYLIVINEKYKLNLSPSEIIEAADIYWKGVSESLQYYPDALVFMNKAKEMKIPLIWMTGSDARAKITKGYSDDWEVLYEPEYSRKKKMERLPELWRDFPGIVEIGDPIDKPEPEFYDKVFAHTKGINYEDILVVGDSELNDLVNARERGCRTILIKR